MERRKDCGQSIFSSILVLCYIALVPKTLAYFQSIRLVDGGSDNEGRVEILYDHTWGTMCDDDFKMNEANVICRMLGYTGAELYAGRAYFGAGLQSMPIWLDNVHCNGQERNITDCELKHEQIEKAFGDADCQHDEDVGVICFKERIEGFDIKLGGVRMTNLVHDAGSGRLLPRLRPSFYRYNKIGATPKPPLLEGFLEVKTTSSSSNYRKVCNNNWTEMDSFVACGQLGYLDHLKIEEQELNDILDNELLRTKKKMYLKDNPSARRVEEHLLANYTAYYYSAGNFNCIGTENEVSWCEHDRSKSDGKYDCEAQGGRPVYLRCRMLRHKTDAPKNIQKTYRQLISRNKGYGRQASHSRDIANFNLGLAASDIEQRIGSHIGRKNIPHSNRIPNVRVRAGAALASGRVEVMIRGRWGAICDRNWTFESANVVCRQLGFGTAKNAFTRSKFGPGHNPIWLTDVQCKGFEKDIFECPMTFVKNGYSKDSDNATVIEREVCSHDREIGVECNAPFLNNQKRIRLISERFANYNVPDSPNTIQQEGRVEVKVGSKWGSICSDGWGILESVVVCRQLGLGYAKAALKDAYFYQYTNSTKGRVVMSEVKCNGNELSLDECEYKKGSTALKKCRTNLNGHSVAAGIICQTEAPNLVTDVPVIYNSLHVDHVPTRRLQCAAEEGCLNEDVSRDINFDWSYMTGYRTLLRFTTRTWNKGQVDFTPNLQGRFHPVDQ